MKHGKNLVIIVSMTALLSACGGAPSPNQAAAPQAPTAPSNIPQFTTNYPTTNSGGPTNSNSIAAESYSFKVTGPSGGTGTNPSFTAKEIYTDNILKVRLSASAPGSITGQGYEVGFNCVKYNVTVRPAGSTSGGLTKTIFVSTTGKDGTGTCAGARPNATEDFSEEVGPGHGLVEVVVSPDLYDNCRKYCTMYDYYGRCTMYSAGNLAYGGCSLNQVYYTHEIQTTLAIHVNGTN